VLVSPRCGRDAEKDGDLPDSDFDGCPGIRSEWRGRFGAKDIQTSLGFSDTLYKNARLALNPIKKDLLWRFMWQRPEEQSYGPNGTASIPCPRRVDTLSFWAGPLTADANGSCDSKYWAANPRINEQFTKIFYDQSNYNIKPDWDLDWVDSYKFTLHIDAGPINEMGDPSVNYPNDISIRYCGPWLTRDESIATDQGFGPYLLPEAQETNDGETVSIRDDFMPRLIAQQNALDNHKQSLRDMFFYGLIYENETTEADGVGPDLSDFFGGGFVLIFERKYRSWVMAEIILHEFGHGLFHMAHPLGTYGLIHDGVMNYVYSGVQISCLKKNENPDSHSSTWCKNLREDLVGLEEEGGKYFWSLYGPMEPKTGFRKLYDDLSLDDITYYNGMYCEIDLRFINEKQLFQKM
jgi:hypothetical protein